MGIRTRLAVLACKTSNAVLRRMGRGGTNLPGKIALKIDKDILKELSRGVKVTVVTGTNGKTTTSRMIEQAFEEAGYKYFANKSGANLLTGIITVFAQHCSLSGKCSYTHALIECDEAAFRKTSEMLPVECLVVNNIFRDQLDRYGEITHTLNAIREGMYGSGWMCRFTKRQRLNCLMQCTVFIVRQNMNTITELTAILAVSAVRNVDITGRHRRLA